MDDNKLNKLNSLDNIDLNEINSSYIFSVFNKAKLDKMRYYIKEIFMYNIDLVRKFIITVEQDFIQILQFEVDRNFLIDDIIKFFLSIKIVYLNMKKKLLDVILTLRCSA